MDKEMQQFQNDLMESVRQMKAGKAARTTVAPQTAVAGVDRLTPRANLERGAFQIGESCSKRDS